MSSGSGVESRKKFGWMRGILDSILCVFGLSFARVRFEVDGVRVIVVLPYCDIREDPSGIDGKLCR